MLMAMVKRQNTCIQDTAGTRNHGFCLWLLNVCLGQPYEMNIEVVTFWFDISHCADRQETWKRARPAANLSLVRPHHCFNHYHSSALLGEE